MSQWIYLFTTKNHFPDPLEEISFMASLEEEGEEAFLLLSNRRAPPLSGGEDGDTVFLCTRPNKKLLVRGKCKLSGCPIIGPTPESVVAIHGEHRNRSWRRISEIRLFSIPKTIEELGIHLNEALFSSGQAYVKKLACKADQSSRKRPHRGANANVAVVDLPSTNVAIKLPLKSDLKFIGADLTAGTWESGLECGKKDFPFVFLCSDIQGLSFAGIEYASKLEQFRNRCVTACQVSIDGPCAATGIELCQQPGPSQKFAYQQPGFRLAERQLSAGGIKLFWTTRNTLENFDGAARWIGRSLLLFRQFRQMKFAKVIETHPHAVFTLLQRFHFPNEVLHPKSSAVGLRQRLCLLQLYVRNIGGQLRNHDDIDAAAASLLAAFYVAGKAESKGQEKQGGLIWIPRFNNS